MLPEKLLQTMASRSSGHKTGLGTGFLQPENEQVCLFRQKVKKMKTISDFFERIRQEKRIRKMKMEQCVNIDRVNVMEFNGELYISVYGEPVVSLLDLHPEKSVASVLEKSRGVLREYNRMRNNGKTN